MIKLSDELYIPPMGDVIAERDRQKSAKKHRREYAAARVNRQNADWTTRPVSANHSLYRDVARLRARARQMANDAPHFRKFLGMCRSNIIGPQGIQLQCQAELTDGSLNTELNKKVERSFWEWTFAENCSVTGKLDWLACQRLFVQHLARDGEVLVQKVAADNPFGFALKFINVDYLDETYNDTLHGGNRVIMSVEIDANDKPVAYWLTTPASEINFTRRRERTRTRVSADQMIHAFLVFDDESQVRGITWFHAALLEGKNLEGYKTGVITSARMAACNIGFIQEEFDEVGAWNGEEDVEDENGRPAMPEIDVTPLSMNRLLPGQTFTQMDPKQPTQNHAEFHKTIVGDIATALGVPYFDLAGDMSAVNFSSARIGLGDSRDMWRGLQDFVASQFCRPVFHAWCLNAMLTPKLLINAHERIAVMNPNWQPRSWPYLEPVKDITADVMALENKLATFTDVLASKGIDLIDHLARLKGEQDLADKMGVELKIASKQPAAAQPNQPDDSETDAPPPPKDDAGRGYTNGKYHDEVIN
ncbi:MAG: phage portal protein [Acidobacteriota bacterium]